jgi:hypothetical protein
MGKIFQSAEVPRVYCGSFRDDQLYRQEFEKLFEKDRNSLMTHLSDLPKLCGMRKINEMVKRIRLNIVNVCLIGYLQNKMPYLWGYDDTTQTKLISNLEKIYVEVRHLYNLPEGDFPPLEEFQGKLQSSNFKQFPKLDRKDLMNLKEMLTNDIPTIFRSIAGVSSTTKSSNSTTISGETTDDEEDGPNPEIENRSLQAMMNFDFNSSSDKSSLVFLQSILIHLIFPLVIAVLILGLGYLISYFLDEGESFRTFLAQIKGLQMRGGV